MFMDKWVTNSLQLWKERKTDPVVLKWEPEFMDIAASGDFGISTGPWELQEFRPNTKPLSTGYFLTVWKKQTDGIWKVILDAGVVTPVISDAPHKFLYPSGADKDIPNAPLVDTVQSNKELIEREKQLADQWEKTHQVAVFTSFLAPAARMQQNGHLPTTKGDTINSWISQRDKSMRWKPEGSGAASSGDMGYTYGVLEIQDDPVAGHYIRIWKKTQDKWLIAIEMASIDKP
jgi:ketosteroid isomerase-like protein